MNTRKTITVVFIAAIMVVLTIPAAGYRQYRYTPAGVYVPKVERTYGMPEPTAARRFDPLGDIFGAIGGLFNALFGGGAAPAAEAEPVPPERLAMARQEYIEYPNTTGVPVRIPTYEYGAVARVPAR